MCNSVALARCNQIDAKCDGRARDNCQSPVDRRVVPNRVSHEEQSAEQKANLLGVPPSVADHEQRVRVRTRPWCFLGRLFNHSLLTASGM